MNKAVAKVCPRCGETTWVGMPAEKYEEWQMGVNIQDAWPEGSATERETLISGFCPECQNTIFDEVNEEPETLGETFKPELNIGPESEPESGEQEKASGQIIEETFELKEPEPESGEQDEL